MTWYNAHSLGRLDLETNTVDGFEMPCMPAFLTQDADGSFWAGCWNDGNIVQFDPVTGTGKFYLIPNGSSAGGISLDPSGRVVFTQNTVGRVAVLDPVRAEAFVYQLPSRPQFKDGLHVARNGTIWAPSPYRSVMGKIVP